MSYPDVNSLPKLAEIFEMSVDEMMQIKAKAVQEEEEKSVRSIVSLILRAMCLAMGVSVAVLGVMGSLNANSGMIMLGFGMACAGISLLEKK